MDEQRGWPAWTAQLNDLIGGWIVTTYPYPLSEHFGGDPMKCGYVVAECITEEDAQKIADLLRRACYVPTIEHPDQYRWVTVGYLEGTLRAP